MIGNRHLLIWKKAGLLKEASSLEASLSDTDIGSLIENTDAASVSRSTGGRPQAKAYLKRARSELDESCQSELKRLRVSISLFQRQR